jgi:hypothetical protein
LFIEGLIKFEEVTQPKSSENSERHTEKKQVTEIECHLPDHFEPDSNQIFVN